MAARRREDGDTALQGVRGSLAASWCGTNFLCLQKQHWKNLRFYSSLTIV